ncbi:NifU family protein [Candidatus Uhrbacteria bacterium]|nr:NifU family protein [Candidatus Uhrbacteria bacterium]
MEAEIQALLEEAKPALARHGGSLEFVSFDAKSGTVFIRFHGACKGCPLSSLTLKMGIESLLCDSLPAVRSVEAVDDTYETTA